MINTKVALARVKDLTHQLAYHREQIRQIGHEINDLATEIDKAIDETVVITEKALGEAYGKGRDDEANNIDIPYYSVFDAEDDGDQG